MKRRPGLSGVITMVSVCKKSEVLFPVARDSSVARSEKVWPFETGSTAGPREPDSRTRPPPRTRFSYSKSNSGELGDAKVSDAITAACPAVEPSVPAESVCAMLATPDPSAVRLSVNWARASPSAALLLATARVPSCPVSAKAPRCTAPSSDVNESDTKPPTELDSNPTVTPAKSKRMSVVGVPRTCEGSIDRTETRRPRLHQRPPRVHELWCLMESLEIREPVVLTIPLLPRKRNPLPFQSNDRLRDLWWTVLLRSLASRFKVDSGSTRLPRAVCRCA